MVTASVASPGRVFALPGSTESTVVTVDPTRVLDTRYDIGLTGRLQAFKASKLQVTGTIDTWIEADQQEISRVVVPQGATGVLLNVTAVSPTGAGYLSVRPGDATGVPATAGIPGLQGGPETTGTNGVPVRRYGCTITSLSTVVAGGVNTSNVGTFTSITVGADANPIIS